VAMICLRLLSSGNRMGVGEGFDSGRSKPTHGRQR
jgi:hypothetical protein